MLVILKNEHTKKVTECKSYVAVSERAGIIVALTSRGFSYDLLQNLAESFSLVRTLILVCTIALFMRSVKM